MQTRKIILTLFLLFVSALVFAQQENDPKFLTLERIFASSEFNQERQAPIQWIENGDAYITVAYSQEGNELIRWESETGNSSVFVPKEVLLANGKSLEVESFSLSEDESKVLIFTNSSRVWRSNTKGDYWVYDLESKKLSQLGKSFEPSSLMFAKFSADNAFVAYVHKFNLYRENFATGTITQLTFDGTDKIINGTFDWAYEEEFGKRDGFSWSPDGKLIAFWQIDASEIGTFYMINNIDSVYSQPIPLQYPKVGQTPAGAKIGLVNPVNQDQLWIPIPGSETENYLPGMQWVNEDLMLIQQMNRKQNRLTVWSYKPSSKALKEIYVETEDTWVDLGYPDISANGWGNNDLKIVDEGTAFLRMTENGDWRNIIKVNLETGQKSQVTQDEFDVASFGGLGEESVYFIASPDNPTQRYLFSKNLNGEGEKQRITPATFSGVNTYDIAPNGEFAIHTHQSTREVRTVRLIKLPSHEPLKILVSNQGYIAKRSSLDLPKVEFAEVTTTDEVTLDARIVYPLDFDPNKKYPVLFHVYGEPWGATAVDTEIGLFDVMLAQKGYFIIDMDNRGTPTLKGSAWRKSIYRNIGKINVQDQGLAAKEILKRPYLDASRVAVWGWSGGGSMTLNLLFKFPEVYQTGISVASVSNQLIYDNIYQERYMGLPQENMEDFLDGSPITHAKNLEGNLLLIHGTGDDNVHYQSAEILINELVKHNKQFQVMPYPNRSHGIYEGEGTRLHLYTLLMDYLTRNTPVN